MDVSRKATETSAHQITQCRVSQEAALPQYCLYWRHRGNNASGQAPRRLTKACHVHKVPRNDACSFSHKVQGGSPSANAARLVEEKENWAK